MKKLIIAVVISLLAVSPALAVSVVTGPQFQDEISTQRKVLTCERQLGKELVSTQYMGTALIDESEKKIFVRSTKINGEITHQRVEAGSGKSLSIVYIVRNSKGKNWLQYKEDEAEAAFIQLYAELGLNETQYMTLFTSCEVKEVQNK